MDVSAGVAVTDAVTDTAAGGRADELAGLRRRMAAMSGRPDQRVVEVRDRSVGVLPVPESLSDILPHNGIPRGSVARLDGARSVLIAMIASVTRAGGQVGIVGLPRLSLLPAAEMGADLSRIATIPDPGPDPVEVAAVLLDGMDLVILDLGSGGQGDAPGAVFQLPVEQRRAHGGLAMGRQLHAIGLDEPAHPGQVVFDAALAQHGDRQADVVGEDVPAVCLHVLHQGSVRGVAEALAVGVEQSSLKFVFSHQVFLPGPLKTSITPFAVLAMGPRACVHCASIGP